MEFLEVPYYFFNPKDKIKNDILRIFSYFCKIFN